MIRLGQIPLVDVQARDLLDSSAGQHESSDGTGIGWVDGRVRAFQPAIELYEPSSSSQRVPWTLGLVAIPEAGLKGMRNRRGDVFR